VKKRAFSALAALCLATPAFAQYGGRRRSRPDGKGESKEQPNPFEVTLHELHEDLKLSAEQEKTWQPYEQKLRAMVDDQRRERSHAGESLELPKRIDRIVDGARNRLTALEDVADAAKALYAGLTPQQQAAADPRLANVIALSISSR
jgi:hypothetical protein